ncbi:MAG: 4-hydroxy-3-methylbut-2-enyl diphosphate reductase [Rickettsiales bacterium]|nr:4-hydroxy-3-methylbut-2-enyl diphosphate reductase [Rickettsiales bacterium]
MPEMLFASKYGFCSGVARAIRVLEDALEKYGPPVYAYHKIVHNGRVIAGMEKRGVVFIDGLDDMADLSRPLVLSAHGSSSSLLAELGKKGINYIDAVCPFVDRIHGYARGKAALGYAVIVIGSDRAHDEIVGTMGQAEGSMFFVKSAADVGALPLGGGSKICYVSQTTLALGETGGIIRAIKTRFPGAEGPGLGNICMATSERQAAARELVRKRGLDCFVVIGSPASSNTKSLAAVIRDAGCENVFLIDSAADIRPGMFAKTDRLGITAGASTPQELIDEVVAKISSLD